MVVRHHDRCSLRHLVGPALPRFVVTTMTPLAASAPYKVAADGPLNTSIFSMEFGSIWSSGDGAGTSTGFGRPRLPPVRLVRFPLRLSDCTA